MGIYKMINSFEVNRMLLEVDIIDNKKYIIYTYNNLQELC